jgi:Ran GTPase-activating protein (RanGAP) involved in mRNA processing and transport
LEDVIISDAGLGDGQIVDIILALSMHPCLVSVSLCGNIMKRNACMALSTLIQWTTTELLDLELDDNAIGDEGMELLVTGLSSSASLNGLRLANNGITSIGIEALSNVLKSPNSQLSHLGLNFNSFGDNGANILASSLANNVSLKSIDLFRCNITDEGWKAFANLICDSSSVNKTHLSNHTLFALGIGKSRNHSSLFTRDVTPFLNYNIEGAKEKVAVKKIIKAHQNISMHPFFEWDLKVLPVAVKWSTIQQRKLSAIYQFIRGMPLLYIKGCSKRELSELQHKDMIVQQEKMMLEAKLRALVIREDRIQARKTACIHRLSGR